MEMRSQVPSEKARLLNDFFPQVLTVEGQDQLPHIEHNIPNEECIQTVFFSPEDVWKSISSCKNTLSCGPDTGCYMRSGIFNFAQADTYFDHTEL